MIRLIVFALVFLVTNLGARWLLAKMGIAIDLQSYGIGFVVAAVIGFAWSQIEGWRSTAAKAFQPQKVTIDTKETPFQVTAAAVDGCFLAVIVLAGLVALAYFLVRDAAPFFTGQ